MNSFALASGAPVYAGLLSGIIGGLIVPLISRSRLGVSGPAAGLSTVVASAILSLGDYRLFLMSLIIAGLFQFLIGVFKFGEIVHYFPSSVIKGMLAAIGIILISKQIPLALGYDQPDFWTDGFVPLFSSHHFLGSMSLFEKHISVGAFCISIFSIGLLILLKNAKLKKLFVLPAPLWVVLWGVLLSVLFSQSDFALNAQQFVKIPASLFGEFNWPMWSGLLEHFEVWKIGLVVGLLATLETLLCVEAVDKLDTTRRITPVNRELMAQGVGNFLCGIVGAIPITAVVVRGAANAEAGAKTKMAAFFHGVFLLLAVLCIPFLLDMIPYACLAGILMMTGFHLAKPQLFKEMWLLGPKQFLPFLMTIFVILATDLLLGVGIGLLISTYFILLNNFKAEYKVSEQKFHGIKEHVIKLNTNVTFLNKVNLQKVLRSVPDKSLLTIDGSDCSFIDYDILVIIYEYCDKASEHNIEVKLKGIPALPIISKLGH